MATAVSSVIAKAGHLWCDLMHDDIMWPVDGRYRCRTCLREIPVEWNKVETVKQPAAPEFRPPVELPAGRSQPSLTA